MVHADGSATLLPHAGGVALGVMPAMEYQTHSVTLEKGDTVLMYTDGVTEAQNPDREQFGLERLRETFRDQAPEGAEAATGEVFRAVGEFAGGAAQFDDITCLELSQWS